MLKYLKRIKEKKGSGAIISMLLIAGLLPLLLFTFIDVPYYNQYHRRMKNIVDNTAASAVTRLNEELLSAGTIELDKAESMTLMYEILEDWFGLEPYLYPASIQGSTITGFYMMKRTDPDAEGQLLDSDPLVYQVDPDARGTIPAEVADFTRIEFFIHTNNNTEEYQFLDGTVIEVSTPTVGVFVQSTMYGVVWRYPMIVKKYGVSEVVLDPYINTPVENAP